MYSLRPCVLEEYSYINVCLRLCIPSDLLIPYLCSPPSSGRVQWCAVRTEDQCGGLYCLGGEGGRPLHQQSEQ